MSREALEKIVDFLTGEHSSRFQVIVKKTLQGHSIKVLLNNRTRPNLDRLRRVIEREHGLPFEWGKHYLSGDLPWGKISVLKGLGPQSKPPEVHIQVNKKHSKTFERICAERRVNFRKH
ncbi:MAG: hypothetical protein Q8R15_00240 [Candidatus Micrarchaeota archaeon]|nr:hypothetical protein [Candidatus Micrarchaeota archaeon]